MLLPVMLFSSATVPVAVLELPPVLAKRVLRPVAVLKSPVVLKRSALSPKAVLLNPPVAVSSTFTSALVPPAVLECMSLVVGLQPGAAQTWPKLGVVSSIRTRAALTVR